MKVRPPKVCTVKDITSHLDLCPSDFEVICVTDSGESVNIARILKFAKEKQVWIMLDETGEGFGTQDEDEETSVQGNDEWEKMATVAVMAGMTCCSVEDPVEAVKQDVCAVSRAKQA
jgi:hypothetical protein